MCLPNDASPPPNQEYPQEDARRPELSEPRTWTSDELFDGSREILIRHDDAVYRLRITRLGKLILGK